MHTLFGITLVLYLLKLSAGKGLIASPIKVINAREETIKQTYLKPEFWYTVGKICLFFPS